jgi:sulfhydrogenase subunit beta (sulfur reductase)
LDLQFIAAANLNSLLASLSSSVEVFVPKLVESRPVWESLPDEASAGGRAAPTAAATTWQRLAPEAHYQATAIRVDHPVKGFFFAAQEGVGAYPAREPFEPKAPRRAIVGAKACDLVALKTYDAIFAGDSVKDDFYSGRRKNTLIVAADCPEPAETCWCEMLGGKPWPTEGFDLSLAAVEGGHVVEVGSEQGRALVGDTRWKGMFAPATAIQTQQRDASRRAAQERLTTANHLLAVRETRQKLVRRQDRAKQWAEGVSTCVECGACLFACPTCHCFLLHDYPAAGGGAVRAKAWDACIYGGYHLMAGGGSPRADLIKRFRNRWMHKFDYFVDGFGFEACSGCGRCISGCPGKIDLRKVIKSMEGGES